MGLSPHIRGNVDQETGISWRYGSIPAHTGERAKVSHTERLQRVYPRTYGGTALDKGFRIKGMGLSPHIRGNGEWWRGSDPKNGSIPAHTGERTSALATA